ncbi:MAG: amidohydrolase family protein [Candidatus Cloacimonetes bacterium]|nr:amidohydrolase family protein [Candidatus Cloacimonadota bacterium]
MKLFTNAHFISMSDPGETYCAMLTDCGKIIKMYAEEPTNYHGAELIDLDGAWVYPGFIDTHTHSFEGGLYSLGVNLHQAKTLDDVFAALRETKPIGGMIFAFHFDEHAITEQRFPTAAELDAIWPDTPLILRRVDGHSCVINSIAARRIPWEEPLPADFDGYLFKRPNDVAANWFHLNLDDEGILQAYHQAARAALQRGHTTIHTMIGNGRNNPEHYRLIEDNAANFPIDFILYPQITDVPTALNLGASRIGGCILADGSFGSHTAALSEPYSDDPTTSGELYQSDEMWMNMIRQAHAADLQVAVHCIGDRAIKQILRCYLQVQREHPKDLRHELIHNELVDDGMLKDMAEARITAVMQPMFDRLWGGPGGLYETVLGKERTRLTNRFASIMAHGITCSGGSDWYVTELDALAGIHAAMHHHNPAQQLSAHDAISLYTSRAARISHDENRIGTLQRGLDADFVVLNSSITEETDFSKIAIIHVFKRGTEITVS